MACPYYSHNCTCMAQKILAMTVYIPTIEEELRFCTTDYYESCSFYRKVEEKKDDNEATRLDDYRNASGFDPA